MHSPTEQLSESHEKIGDTVESLPQKTELQELIAQFNLDPDGVKDLSIAALIAKLLGMADTNEIRSQLASLLTIAGTANAADQKVGKLLGNKPAITTKASKTP